MSFAVRPKLCKERAIRLASFGKPLIYVLSMRYEPI